ERLRQHNAAAPVAARIEQQNTIILERPLEPARVRDRPRSGKSGPSLQENEPGQRRVRLLALADSPRENRQCLARWLVVLEPPGEFVVGEIHAVMAGGGEGA